MAEVRDILIADAGGTSTRWCLLDADGHIRRDMHGAPINACLLGDEGLRDALRPVEVLSTSSQAVYFYGAGCANERECGRIATHIRALGYDGELHIQSDMAGAARSLFGDRPGLACILGTGSNSCLYDGDKVVRNIAPLGYLLGDEGSGASIGKRFLKALMRGQMPSGLISMFYDESRLSPADIYEKVYREPRPNTFLASLTHFIRAHISEAPVRKVVSDEFDAFFGMVTSGYDNACSYPVGFVGSVAYCFGQLLRDSASRHGMEVARIDQDPMPGLLRYHSRQNGIKLQMT